MRSLLFELVPIFICGSLLQAQSAWKEYIYPQDGFAVMLPYEPSPHQDSNNPDITVYTVRVEGKVGLSIRVVHENRDCAATLGLLRDGAKAGRQPGIDLPSIREFSLNGYPGVEYEYGVESDQKHYERYYCVNKRFYIFSFGWPDTQPKPQEALRVIRSFRLLAAKY